MTPSGPPFGGDAVWSAESARRRLESGPSAEARAAGVVSSARAAQAYLDALSGSPIEQLRAAIERSGYSARAFAVQVLDVDERTVRYWLAGEREMPGPVRQIVRAILAGHEPPPPPSTARGGA